MNTTTLNATKRAAWTFIAAILATITLVCGAFLILNQPIPEWFVIVGRWIPAIVALIVIRAYKLDGGLARWWQLRPGGLARFALGSLIGLAALVGSNFAAAYLYANIAWIDLHPWPVIGQMLLMVIPMALVFTISTFGEEVAWRGFLQQAFEGWGYLRASATISVIWVLFHVPLHGTMALQGVLPWHVAIASTLGLFALGMFLSAITLRFGSIWPAAIAHAAPLTALNFFTNVDALAPTTVYGVTALTSVILIIVGAVIANRTKRATRPAHTPVQTRLQGSYAQN
ncbi:MAG: CPBP family glutamic-type intramembrane protease [Gulosibacter sp.]|uniref:CPBP family intramembrane glutamic endopeptidase n=1 Tax=Gulosibacter sp. TaxID=2817531 RepID=UPI003F8E31A5